ncbi:MAG TPA: DUF6259 domain-containing protein [Armatimonadota bacterium]|jgi:hypothetical protein
MAKDGTVKAVLNGLSISVDARTGALRRLEYPGPGLLLDADAGEAGLVDLAYPVEGFEPLRLATRYSEEARVETSADRVTIHLDKLGPSRSGFQLPGEVSAVITLRAHPDGRSVLLSCELENHSKLPVRQVIFPELRGLVPVAGADHTILKTCGFGSAPFRELVVPEADQWYAQDSSTVSYDAGGMHKPMWTRWLDLGGLKGGFSLFPLRWGWDPQVTTVAQLRQSTHRLRLLSVHPDEIAPGARWSSGDWLLTPHRSGWAKGIEPYRQWVSQHLKRRYPMPRHIRDGLGFRTVWMCQNQPKDPTDVVWRFRDLPEVAREAREHGLTEVVTWAWQPAFDASLPTPFPHLGGEAELQAAAEACRKLGVTLTPFISVLQANPRTAGRYGLKVPDNNGWTYHTDMIPRWNPPYATGLSCVQVGPSNRQWQDEVAEACKRWADKGLPSLSWDQYWSQDSKQEMQALTQRIRDYARKLDPESSFSGEELWNVEVDAEWLDYTWNWGAYRDCQAFINAFPAPRPNVNINRSVAEARYAFMDSLFLNVWPSKPDGINGSERISRVPALSATLKTCAGLRKRFLPYFTEGTLIGDCLLTEPSAGVRLSAYQLPDRVLAIVLNQGPDSELQFSYDLSPWLPNRGRVTVKQYGEDGRQVASRVIDSKGTLSTGPLKPLQMTVFEFSGEG